MPYEELIFKRGFLVTDWDIASVDNRHAERVHSKWDRRSAGRLTVYHDPELPFCSHAGGRVTLALLGTVIDPVNRLGEAADVLRELHDCMSRSTEGFFERLDDLSGRFAILVESSERAFVVLDPCGTRSLFYDDAFDGVTLSSHSSLLAEIKGRRMTDAAREFIRSYDYVHDLYHFPGLTTPYPGIKILTPNTFLDLERGKVERFYPRGRLARRPLSQELAGEISDLFRSQVALLRRSHPLAVSITAGADSRATMAATAEYADDIHYYTYIEQPVHEVEASIAAGLCAGLGVPHTVYRIEEGALGRGVDDYMDVWRLNTARMRPEPFGLISKVLLESYPAGRLHLKSSLAEIGRADSRSKRRFLPRKIDPDVMARLYRINSGSEFVKSAFREFAETVDYGPGSVFDFDVYDLFFWEHKCCAWQSLQIADMDTAQDTFVLYNNRRVLENMLGLPLEDRLWGRLLPLMIRDMWPDGAGAPFLKDVEPWHRKAPRLMARKAKYRMETILEGRRV